MKTTDMGQLFDQVEADLMAQYKAITPEQLAADEQRRKAQREHEAKRTPKEADPYKAHGYEDRADYLESLAEEYPADLVYTLADLLGPDEDFDGLVTGLEDYNE